MTAKYVAEWEKIRMSRIRNEHRRRWFQWEIARFRETGRHLDLIPMYEAIIEVIERRYKEYEDGVGGNDLS
ncbi:MAG TPA: hypothetical protein VIG47_08070 [Gemmatimonadaceae bacterium]